jgi:aspartate/methionine/tyrosine aminotransferase
MIYKKNPSLDSIEISRPIVGSALTHSLSICGYLFVNESDKIITPDLYWGNYRLMFVNAFNAQMDTYPTFKDNGFNIDGLKEKISGPKGKKIVILNFPNNPTGYTPTDKEAEKIKEVFLESAEAGNEIVALIDDAYFGLVYESGVITESIFTKLANLHENILAVKVDGATKEDYVWGFRVGFITFGIKGATAELYKCLEDKTAGAIRGNISNSPNISQSILQKAYTSDTYKTEKNEKYNILKERYLKLRDILSSKDVYKHSFTALPFNSGYFMCIKINGADPEKVRQVLLEDYSTGVIATSGVIRIAFSATPIDFLEELFENIHQAVQKCQ